MFPLGVVWTTAVLLGGSFTSAYLAPIVQPIRPECRVKGAFRVGDKCLLAEPTKLNWQDAQRYCSHLGGRLVELTDGDLYFGLIKNLRHKGVTDTSFFVGAAQRYRFSGWQWVLSGEPIHPSFWTVTINDGKILREPQPSSDPRLRCGLLDAGRAHFLNKADCYSKQSFICEMEVTLPSHQPPQYPPPKSHSWVHHFFSEGGEQNSTVHCPEGWSLFSEEGRCYVINETAVSFYEADSNCQDGDAHLADILTEEEDVYLAGLAQNSVLRVGLIRTSSSGNFSWTSGKPYEYMNWLNGEPAQDYPGVSRCLEITSQGWSSDYCSLPKGYICETTAQVYTQ